MVGCRVGNKVGDGVGCNVGGGVGSMVGSSDGMEDGLLLRSWDGTMLGAVVGASAVGYVTGDLV